MTWILRLLLRFALSLRYRVRVEGLDAVARRGRRGILFLPNHPAFIDPIILLTQLAGRFAPRPLIDRDQLNNRFFRWVARRIRALDTPHLATHGPQAKQEVERSLDVLADALRAGDNVVLYPSGHLYRTRYEDLRGNSAAHALVQRVPDARVVLVRTRGLWGSFFSMASGQYPDVPGLLKRGAWTLLKNLVFFAPRRPVLIEFVEPRDLPREADRQPFNEQIERFYNEVAPPNTFVPYHFLDRDGVQVLPEPARPAAVREGPVEVPEDVRKRVYEFIKQNVGVDSLRDEDRLATDLGMDSLARAELVLWLAKEFGFAAGDTASLQSVADVLLAARGETAANLSAELRPIPPAWFRPLGGERVKLLPGDDICDVFLAAARRDPSRVVLADQLSGVRTFRDIVTGVLALRPHIERLPGRRVGIMLPASVGASVTYLATVFAGKEPVMLNWTVGARNMQHALELAEVQRVLTVAPLVARVEALGTDLSAIRDRFVMLEDVRGQIGFMQKIVAALRARFYWGSLDRVMPAETAVILLTSGSESLPKAVPLSHANLIANLRDALGVFTIREDDALLGFLPPFHSFGITVTTLLPLLTGVRATYHANPTEGWMLARLIQAYKATVLCGTPTFLNGILRASGADELASLRLAVVGAEKCPDRVYELFARRCPQAQILEGYGITECSPVIAANRPEDPRPGTIGRVLPALEWAVLDADTHEPVSGEGVGVLHVRGPSVFGGYLGNEIASPFVEHAGKSWYRTGDLVSAASDGVLTFRGRLKRFVKLGGEMISLPAIESVLEKEYAGDNDEGPVVAVEAAPNEDHPQIVLFTTRDIDRATANGHIRAAGLSALHNVARVVKLDAIPVLGTGKTDNRALREGLKAGRW